MPSPIVSSTNPGSFSVDGSYIFAAASGASTPVGPNTSTLFIVGPAQWGPMNTPQRFSGSSDGGELWGGATVLGAGVTSIMGEVIDGALPECSSYYGSRIGDGTQAAASAALPDTATGTVGTFAGLFNGTLINGASVRVDLSSGTAASKPVFRVTLTYPNGAQEVFNGIVGYATTAYSSTVFLANLTTAINVGTKYRSKSAYVVFTAGSSTVAPSTGVPYAFAGGSDGVASLTSAAYVGTDGNTGRTGLYAFRGLVAGAQGILAGVTDPTVAPTLSSFASQEGCIMGALLGPQGTTSAGLISARATNNVAYPNVVGIGLFDSVYDPTQGGQVYTSPLGAVMGVIASLNFWQSPGNKPKAGKGNLLGTEATLSGQVIDQVGLESNGILYLTRPAVVGGPQLFGLPHGLMSDGVTQISDTRAFNYFVPTIAAIGAQFVGRGQTTNPNDKTRTDYVNAIKSLLAPFVSQGRISAYSVVCDLTNNTPTSIQQGFLNSTIAIQTLSNVRFVLAVTQVGNTVQVQTQAANPAA